MVFNSRFSFYCRYNNLLYMEFC